MDTVLSGSVIPDPPPSGTPETLGRETAVTMTTEPEADGGAAAVYAGHVVGQQRQNQVGTVVLAGQPIVSLHIDGKERLCLAQISNTLLKEYSYNEIHNRRVALGITCVQCTPVQLEILRRAGAMPISSRRCGMITKREAERLVKSFLEDTAPPKLPDNFAFQVKHSCGWGCKGSFVPSRYNSSRAKCIKCTYCSMFFSPNKFIFHFHRVPDAKYRHPDAANFNSWRRHLHLDYDESVEELDHAWEDVKAMFNGGSRRCERRCSVTSQAGPPSPRAVAPPDGVKRPRVDAGPPPPAPMQPLPGKLGSPGYQYPLLPCAPPAAMRPLPAPYLRPPHPAFTGMLPPPDGPMTSDAVKLMSGYAQMWRGRDPPALPCNPFSLLLGRGLGLDTPAYSAPWRAEPPLTTPPGGGKRRASDDLWSPAGQLEKSNQLKEEEQSRDDGHLSAFRPVTLKDMAGDLDDSASEDEDNINVTDIEGGATVTSVKEESVHTPHPQANIYTMSREELQSTLLRVMTGPGRPDVTDPSMDLPKGVGSRDANGNRCGHFYPSFTV